MQCALARNVKFSQTALNVKWSPYHVTVTANKACSIVRYSDIICASDEWEAKIG